MFAFIAVEIMEVARIQEAEPQARIDSRCQKDLYFGEAERESEKYSWLQYPTSGEEPMPLRVCTIWFQHLVIGRGKLSYQLS